MPEEVPANTPLSQACPECGTIIDVSEEEPFAKVQCPSCGGMMRARAQFNNFILQKQLGAGGMGAVYKALDVSLNRMVALKLVLKEYSSDPAYHAKLEHEARITASINHPHVVKVFSFGSDQGLFYIAMELVDAGSLDDFLHRDDGRVPELKVLDTGIQVAQGLDAAFKRGLIHRDVKPGNILFSDEHTAKIVDFGLAVPMERGAEGGKEGEPVWGTPYYIAPEKLTYQPEDLRSDIYSLGASLYHALAGKPAVEAETTSLRELLKLKSKPVSIESVLPNVSSATAYVINRTMALDPKDRHQSYEELIEHLNYARTKLIGKRGGKQAGSGHGTPAEAAGKKNLLIAAAIAVAALIAGFFWMHGKQGAEKTTAAATPAPTKAAIPVPAGEQGYIEGRKHLASGDFKGAQEIFHEMETHQTLPHPLDRWVIMHEGLAALLGGHGKDAQTIYSKLEELGMYSNEPEDRVLANFFVSAAHDVASAKPVPADAAGDFTSGGSASLGLLILAVDDWEQSQFDDANALFQQFLAAEPKAPYGWIADYKPLAQKYAADYDAYKKLADAIGSATTLPQQKVMLDTLHAVQGSLQVPGRLPEKLAGIESDLQKKIAAGELEEKRRAEQQARLHEEGEKALAAVMPKYNACVAVYQFTDAADTLSKIEIQDETASTEKANLLKKAQWLQKFKETLISDINITGYPLQVTKLNNIPIDGQVRRATPMQLEIQTQYGSVAVLWTEMPASEILAMSGYFTGKSMPVEIAPRQWLSGVFAMMTGQPKEGKGLLDSAAQTREEYRQQRSLFDAAAQ